MTSQLNLEELQKIATWIRYHILTMTTQAGSGHPTSSLSGVELMAGLFFGGFFRYDLAKKDMKNFGKSCAEGENGKGAAYRTICRSICVDPGSGRARQHEPDLHAVAYGVGSHLDGAGLGAGAAQAA